MHPKFYWIFIALLYGIIACKPSVVNDVSHWKGQMRLSRDVDLPLRFTIARQGDTALFLLFNGAEELNYTLEKLEDNRYKVVLSPYNSFLEFNLENDDIQGLWHNPEKSPEYKLKFSAERVKEFQNQSGSALPVGKWNAYFVDESGKGFPAVGEFDNTTDGIAGTFRTETGDYRYLWGGMKGNLLTLSSFDGANAFVFSGKVHEDSITDGHFYSGNHYHSQWRAGRSRIDPLRDPFSISTFSHKVATVKIQLPKNSLPSQVPSVFLQTQHVWILEIMGTWCPNCKDAARFLNTMRNKYFEKGLRIAGFCFERGTPEAGAEKVRRYAQRLNLSYPLVYAGSLKVEEVNKVFPGLKNFSDKRDSSHYVNRLR
jgi:hypothetical protein